MGESRKSNLFCFLAVFAVFIAIALNFYRNFSQRHELMIVINSMENIEIEYDNIPERHRSPRVAIGFGGCTDYFSRAISCFTNLNMSGPNQVESISNEEHHELHSLEDINKEFSQFFIEGAAAERYVHNADLFEQIQQSVTSLKDITQTFVGGNAPVMANRLAIEGAIVLLGAKLSGQQTSFLHENVSVVAMTSHNETEDRHLILEYDVGEQWGALRCPRANRFIVHRDRHTPFLTGLEEMGNTILDFRPDIFILGGLQMMDGFPYQEGEMKQQIDKLQTFLSKIPKTVPIHFEMASFIEKDFFLMLKNQIIPYADSLGFNEQELPNLLSILANDSITPLSAAYPKTSQMLDTMRRVWELIVDRPTSNNIRNRLSRLHLHTIGYQIIMTNKHSKFWRSSRSSVAKASLVAHRHTCGIHNIDVERSKLLMDDSFSISGIKNSPRVHFKVSDPVSCWEEREVEICVAPVLVCTKVIRTVGGGDNISSAALLNQLQIST